MENFEENVPGMVMISVDRLRPDPAVPTRGVDEKKDHELAQSIKVYGVLLPLLVREGNEAVIYVVAGNRRLRAATLAGVKEVPCVFSSQSPALVSVVENIQRQNLSAVEEAEILKELVEAHGFAHEALGRLLGRRQSSISEALSITKLPEGIKAVARGDSSVARTILVELAKVEDPDLQLRYFQEYRRGELTRGALRRATRNPTGNMPVGIKGPQGTPGQCLSGFHGRHGLRLLQSASRAK